MTDDQVDDGGVAAAATEEPTEEQTGAVLPVEVADDGVWILADNREHDLIAELAKIPEVKDRVVVTTLLVCDVWFVKGRKRQMLLERKTVADMRSSITDARYKEQKARIMATVPNMKQVYYIIEGVWDKPDRMSNAVRGAIGNSFVRDGVASVFTANAAKTAAWLAMTFKSLEKHAFVYGDGAPGGAPDGHAKPTAEEYTATLRPEKKGNMDQQRCWIVQLKCVPKVSDACANAVAAAYPNVQALCRALNALGTAAVSELLLESERRIGIAVAEKLVAHFCDGCNGADGAPPAPPAAIAVKKGTKRKKPCTTTPIPDARVFDTMEFK